MLALARAAALVSVGKRAGRHSTNQRTIDALIVAAARAGAHLPWHHSGECSVSERRNVFHLTR